MAPSMLRASVPLRSGRDRLLGNWTGLGRSALRNAEDPLRLAQS